MLYFDRENSISNNEQRDQRIQKRYAEGETISQLARIYKLSPQRVFQIVQHSS